MDVSCAYCGCSGPLKMSHAIPRAAFTAILKSGSGNAIAIPDGNGNAHLTQDTGAHPLLCGLCESSFNSKFDGPMINSLKNLENAIIKNGFFSSINFDANTLAHAIVSVAWRICYSPAPMYSNVALVSEHMIEMETLLRKPTSEILKYCTVRLSRIGDKTPETSGGFPQKIMGQFLMMPRAYSISSQSNGKFSRFAIEWSMFGFLIDLFIPRLPYPKSIKFGALRANAKRINASYVNILEHPPLIEAMLSGYAANAEGRLSSNLKKRVVKRSITNMASM